MLLYQLLIFMLILVSILIVIILITLNTKRARIRRFIRTSAGIRYELVKEISEHAAHLPDDLTPQEMVSILTLMCAKKSIFHAYHSAMHFADLGFREKYNAEFYGQLEKLARNYSTRKWNLESLELLRLGEMLANKFGESYWSEEFRSYINSLTYLLGKRSSSVKIL